MSFSSCVFLFMFLPISIILFYITPNKIKKFTILVLSILFYKYSSEETLAFLIIFTSINYILGLLLSKFKKIYIAFIGVVLNISILFYYKYANFFIENINLRFSTNIEILNLILPLGISFITFQNISYIIDVYKCKNLAEKNIINFFTYVFFFPKILSGPIVRYQQFKFNFKENKFDNLYKGTKRICFGLGKVLILSSVMGNIWNDIYISNITALTAWLGIICFSLQLYLNFSGYMDIALGLGKVFCIELPENFDYPYTASSISEFWRRWHITLSNWFRDYVYIPLGGNRKGNVYVNLFIVFILTGLWHGSSWNFIAWGIYHGIWIIMERLIREKKFYKIIPKIIKQISTYIIVTLGWVLFAASSLRAAIRYYKCMFGTIKYQDIQYGLLYFLNRYNYIFIILSISVSLPIKNILVKKIKNENIKEIIAGVIALFVLAISIMFMINNSYTPALYAQF